MPPSPTLLAALDQVADALAAKPSPSDADLDRLLLFEAFLFYELGHDRPSTDAGRKAVTSRLIGVYLDPEGGPLDGQLFDMVEDPRELVDLWESPDHAETRERLLGALITWQMQQELVLGSRGGDMFPAPKQRLDNRLKQN